MLSQALSSWKLAYSTIMDDYCHSTGALSEMQGQQSLILCWCSFLEHGSDIFARVFPYNGGWWFDSELLGENSRGIFRDAKPTIIDSLLMLIYWKGQRACQLPFWLYSRPIHILWCHGTMQHFACPMWKTENRWGSTDADFWMGKRQTAFLCSIMDGDKLHSCYWHPVLRYYSVLFASWSFVASQVLSNLHAGYVSNWLSGPIALLRFQLAIDSM